MSKEADLTPIERLDRRAREIEQHAQKRWGSEEEGLKWWPEAIQHAKDLRWAIEQLKDKA